MAKVIIFYPNYPDNSVQIESKVREATNDDEWGPHGGLMQEVAQYTYQYEHFPEVMGMLWRRWVAFAGKTSSGRTTMRPSLRPPPPPLDDSHAHFIQINPLKKVVMDRRTDRRTIGRTQPLIEMRGRELCSFVVIQRIGNTKPLPFSECLKNSERIGDGRTKVFCCWLT